MVNAQAEHAGPSSGGMHLADASTAKDDVKCTEYEAALACLASEFRARRAPDGSGRSMLADSVLVLAALVELKRSGRHGMLRWIETELANLQEFLDCHAAAIDGRIPIDSRWLLCAPRAGERDEERLVSRLGMCGRSALE